MAHMEKEQAQNLVSAAAENSPEDHQLEELIQTLEQQIYAGWRLVKYDNRWYPVELLRPILSARKHFKGKSTDIILATIPKSGTTWLKALAFSIANRRIYPIDQSPLLTSNPHKLVPFLEFDCYWDQENPNLDQIPNPRLFSTHLSFQTLPESILESECKIIFLCRNPLDHFTSYREFNDQYNREQGAEVLELDDAFDMFCQGIYTLGPFWEHVLGYWNAHTKNPTKVLFLRYEDLQKDITYNVKRIGEFMGLPFSSKEKEDGMIELISSLCSFEKLNSLDVNKTGDENIRAYPVKNSCFFRKGQVGDWTNYLTPAMAERYKEVLKSKFEGSGLTLGMEMEVRTNANAEEET